MPVQKLSAISLSESLQNQTVKFLPSLSQNIHTRHNIQSCVPSRRLLLSSSRAVPMLPPNDPVLLADKNTASALTLAHDGSSHEAPHTLKAVHGVLPFLQCPPPALKPVLPTPAIMPGSVYQSGNIPLSSHPFPIMVSTDTRNHLRSGDIPDRSKRALPDL